MGTPPEILTAPAAGGSAVVSSAPVPKHSRILRHLVGREVFKCALGPLLSWPRRAELQSGYSIILGVPWHLRHLLGVNLRFIAAADRQSLRAVHVVLDRANPQALAELRASIDRDWSGLPLKFHCYEGLAGRLVEWIDVSTFYNSMNCATALKAIDTTHAILHDFDLYPTRSDYFERIYRQMIDRRLHYCGVEFTPFDGLSAADQVLGTWGLGMDVGWLRSTHRPIEIFHAVRRVKGRWVMLDPFSHSQLRKGTRRELVDGSDTGDFCHVKNLCSSYLRLSTGRHVTIAWRLHYLWYLESLEGRQDLSALSVDMDRSADGRLQVGERIVDFTGTSPTCASVLRGELLRMDQSLFGAVRPETATFVDSTERFLNRMTSASASP